MSAESIRIPCPSCTEVLMLSADSMGRQVKCGVCKSVFVAGQPLAEVAAGVPPVSKKKGGPPPVDKAPERTPRSRRPAPQGGSVVPWLIGGSAILLLVVLTIPCIGIGVWMIIARRTPEPPRVGNNPGAQPLPPIVDKPEPFKDNPKFVLLDLSIKGNKALRDGTGGQDNNLLELPVGVQKFADVPFRVHEKYMLLDKTKSITDIGVDAKFRRLHVCHATHYTAFNNQHIGNYVLRYEDGQSHALPIHYQRDLLDWWDRSRGKDVPFVAKIGWSGNNPDTTRSGAALRLFVSTYENPHPAKVVRSIDFVYVGGGATPLCVAMTVEKD